LQRIPKRSLAIALGAIAVLSAVIVGLIMSIPPVVGLGNRVKLPLFHGGATWVNLVLFTLMGLAGVVYLFTRNDRVYAWEVGFRGIAAPLWLMSSVLGFIAAASTWDFSQSKESPLAIIPQDPRLSAQAILLAGVAILLLADWLILETRWQKAIGDIVFVGVMWFTLAPVFLDPVKRALHPDSPVLNSGWEIKGPFFGMVAAIFAVAIVASWLVSLTVAPEDIAVSQVTKFE
jgi:hypothetical protein